MSFDVTHLVGFGAGTAAGSSAGELWAWGIIFLVVA